MPDITVKKADGTTDVVYKLLAPSSGDNSDARYACVTGFPIPATRPSFAITATNNGTGSGRRVKASFAWPLQQEDAGGNVKVVGVAPVMVSALLPQNIDQSVIDEIAAQAANLIDSPAFVDSMKSGYAPRN